MKARIVSSAFPSTSFRASENDTRSQSVSLLIFPCCNSKTLCLHASGMKNDFFAFASILDVIACSCSPDLRNREPSGLSVKTKRAQEYDCREWRQRADVIEFGTLAWNFFEEISFLYFFLIKNTATLTIFPPI